MMAFKKILIVDNEVMIRWTLSESLNDWGYVPVQAEDMPSALEIFEVEQPAVVLVSLSLPNGAGLETLRAIKMRQPSTAVVVTTSGLMIEDTVAALRAGACDFIVKPINLDKLRAILKSCLTNFELTDESQTKHKKSKNLGFNQIIGESAKMKELLALARKVAESEVSSILLQGESGTGKDLIAKAIHYSSVRAAKPFVAINCAAIPANLIESELFGYEKGAFTDAKTMKQGLFEQADGGTIFLDEIGELELGLQAKLLRVLEGNSFRRVGGLKDLPLEACVIAASNLNLREASETGKFRQDLYFRLSVIEIDIPPLRERGEDILLLANHFVETLDRNSCKSQKRHFSPEVAQAFRHYRWNGNVRELRNAVERALILEEGEEITLKYMPYALHKTDSSNGNSASPINNFIQLPPGGISLDAVEDSLIEQALQRSQGNVTRAAELLNISRDRLRYYLKTKKKAAYSS